MFADFWGTLPSLQALPATLLHSLWQGAVLSLLVFGALHRIPVKRPNLRYGVAVAGLLGIVLAALITWWALGSPLLDTAARQATSGIASADVTDTHSTVSSNNPSPDTSLTSPPVSPSRSPSLPPFASLSDYLLWMWAAGVLIMTVRLLRLMGGTRRLRRQCFPLEDIRTHVLFDELRETLRLSRRVVLLASESIVSPLAMGLLWPVVVLPASMATGLSPDQVRAILAHELAHIRRYDYLVNFIQLMIEAVCYYNPAVWWLSRQIRIEREACCDAMAARIAGTGMDYAEVLLYLAQHTRHVPSLAAAAQGLSLQEDPKGRLLDRVRRLLVPGYRPKLRLRWYSVALGLLITIALFLGLFQSSRLSVTFAGWFMSDTERIQVMTDLNRAYPPSSQSYDHNNSPKMEVSGEIIPSDGKPLPEGDGYLRFEIVAGNSFISEFISRKGGTFHGSVPKGDLYLLAAFPDYAPTLLGPLHSDVHSSIRDVKVQIVPCKKATVHFTDSNGNPMAGVEVTRMYPFPRRGSSISSIGLFTRTSDNNGNVFIEQATPAVPMNLSVRAKGYIDASRDNLMIKEGETYNWVFSTDNPIEGMVLDKKTGTPIADADIAALFEKGRGWIGDIEGKQVTTTDYNGHFSVYGVSPGTYYYFVVHAKGYGPEIFTTLSRGKESLTVKLGPRYVHGEIKGDLSLLKQDNEKKGPVITWGMKLELSYEHQSHGSLVKDIPVTIENGIGHFQIDELRAGTLEIEAGPKHLRIPVNDPVDNLEIGLNDPIKKRSLVINLSSPENTPPVNGMIKVKRYEVENDQNPDEITIPVVNGRAATEINAPAKISFNTDGLIGYMRKSDQEYWTIPEGTVPHVIDLTLERAGALKGQVLNADGTPAAYESVTLNEINGKGYYFHQTCNDKGEFVMQPLPFDRTFRVSASFGFAQADQKISLTRWKSLEQVTLKLPVGIDTAVNVVDPEGKPIPNCKITVSGPSMTHSLQADASGGCSLKQVNPKTHYTVTACPQEDFQPATIELSLDASKNRIRVEKGLTLEGTLLLKDANTPIPQHLIRVTDPFEVGKKVCKPYTIETMTNAEGKFRFTCLPADPISLEPEGTMEYYTDDPFSKRTFTPGSKEPVVLYMVPNVHSYQ